MSDIKSRNSNIDALKGIAIIAVILLHIPTSQTTNTIGWQLLNILGRFAVPCFFLISGYFFRQSWNRSVNKFQVFSKSAIRVIPIFLFWALLYAVLPPYVGEGDWRQHLQNILRYPHSFIITGNVYHLWFLSSLLQGLLILWVSLWFDRIYIGLAFSILLYAVALCAGTYSVTPLGYPISFDMKNGPFFSTLFVFLGAGLAQGKYLLGKSAAIATALCGFILCIAETSFLHVFYGLPFRGVSMMIGTIPLALGIMNIALTVHDFPRWLAFIGYFSLGIYVVHPWLIEVFENFEIYDISNLPLFFIALVLVTSLLVTWTLEKISYVRKLVI